MTSLIDALTAARVYTPLDAEGEADIVARAQAGDTAAARILLDNHLGVIVNEVTRAVRRGKGFVSDVDRAREEAFTDAILVFYRVIEKYKPGRGWFSGLLKTALRNDPDLAMILNRTRAMTVPRASMDRRAQAIAAAEGDLAKARELAPQFGLARETYDAITQVVQSSNSIGAEGEGTFWGAGRGNNATSQGGADKGRHPTSVPEPLRFDEPGYVHIEDLLDAKAALAVLDPEEHEIICGLFGLNGWPEHSQAELAAELGRSRQTIRRIRDRAMLKMQAHFQDKE